MRWQDQRESENVEDLRSEPAPYIGGGGGSRFSLLNLPFSFKTKLMLLVGIVVAAYLFGGDPIRWLNGDFNISRNTTEQSAQAPENDDAKKFVAVVLGDTEDVWTQIFKEHNATYSFPKVVLFRDAANSGCGLAESAMGPFYCPHDRKVYIDLGFLASMQERLHATGDFAEAYVIAHEIGHHVQNLLGTLNTAGAERGSEGSSVRTELQADCYAGIWAKHTEQMQHTLDPGDIEEAMNAASAVGDDKLQKRTQGYVVPDSFTHGSAAQRQRWFKQGYETGKIEDCDTFNAAPL